MNKLSFHFLLVFFQICLASELGGSSSGGDEFNLGHLIKMKSGKIFLRHSSKEKDREDEGIDDYPIMAGIHDYQNDDKVLGIRREKAVLFCLFLALHVIYLPTLWNSSK